jgi:hypothetical protein
LGKKHNLPVGSSIGPARHEIMLAHQQYDQHKKAISTKSILEIREMIHPDYISGIIEGDGCITLGCLQRKGFSYPRFSASFSLVLEEGGQFLLHVVAKYFLDDRPYIARDKIKASCYYRTSRRPVLEALSEHLFSHPVYFKRKEASCLALILPIWDLTRLPFSGGVPAISEEKACQIVKQIYASGKGVLRRKKPLEQVLREFSFWYSRAC